MVRTNTLEAPGAGDAAVVRVKGTKRALALASDGNGRWCRLDPFVGAQLAVAEAARNVACSGAKPWAATNCLNFGNPEKPEVMWQFSRAIDGIAAACTALEIPITGGNVSFYNETLGRSIDPTPVLGVLGIIEDASRALGMAFRAEGDVILSARRRGAEAIAASDSLEDRRARIFFLRIRAHDSRNRRRRAARGGSRRGKTADRAAGRARRRRRAAIRARRERWRPGRDARGILFRERRPFRAASRSRARNRMRPRCLANAARAPSYRLRPQTLPACARLRHNMKWRRWKLAESPAANSASN